MQAQQQAAAAKQAEMQQQLGAAMMAGYPSYMLTPYGIVRPLPPSITCDVIMHTLVITMRVRHLFYGEGLSLIS